MMKKPTKKSLNMPEIKYKTTRNSLEITAIVVERSTVKSVWIKRKKNFAQKVTIERFTKHSDYQIFHDTWEEAHKFLVNEYQKKITYFGQQINNVSSKLNQLLKMEAPGSELEVINEENKENGTPEYL